MKKTLIILVLPFIITGCSILPDIFTPGKKKIPTAPQRSFWDKEEIRQNADIINDVSDQVYTSGTNAQSYEALVLKDSADVMSLVTGLPAEKIDWTDPDQVKKLHERIRYNELEQKRREHVWKGEVDALSRDKKALEEENSVLRSFKNWFWLSIIALAVITFCFPTVGVFIIKWLLKKGRKAAEVAMIEGGKAVKGQFQQVVQAIEDHKKEDPEGSKKLLEKLHKHTDSTTRDMIKNIKRGKLD